MARQTRSTTGAVSRVDYQLPQILSAEYDFEADDGTIQSEFHKGNSTRVVLKCNADDRMVAIKRSRPRRATESTAILDGAGRKIVARTAIRTISRHKLRTQASGKKRPAPPRVANARKRQKVSPTAGKVIGTGKELAHVSSESELSELSDSDLDRPIETYLVAAQHSIPKAPKVSRFWASADRVKVVQSKGRGQEAAQVDIKSDKDAEKTVDNGTANVESAMVKLPAGKPPVTAGARATLAETLPYFRAYQSGSYFGGGHLRGFYLGTYDVDRGHFDTDVAIARCGGYRSLVNGVMQQTRDVRAEDAQVKHFQKAMASQTPFVLIIGRGYQRCEVRLPDEYNVAGWYLVTSVWAEKINGHVAYMYRIQRVHRDGNEAWWATQEADMKGISTGPKCARYTCGCCDQVSKQVYSFGWYCTNPSCTRFWSYLGKPVSTFNLDYNPDFLAERVTFPEHREFPYSLLPEEPKLADGDAVSGGGFARKYWKGFACHSCKFLSPRRHWQYYQCDRCGRRINMTREPISMDVIRDPHALVYTGHALHSNLYNADRIKHTSFALGWFVFNKYDLGHGNTVWHIQSNEKINGAEGGPDEMLKELQTDEKVGLERHSMGNKHGKHESLVNHFSVNYGMPYKYIVATMSRSFKEAPKVILRALERCQWVAEAALGKENFDRFNECLAVGYMENGSMGFHDDGEKELGDTVTAMCIGGDAEMSVRLKDEHYKGFIKTGTPVNPRHRIPHGAVMTKERAALNDKYRDMPWNAETKKAMGKEMQEIARKARASGLKFVGEANTDLDLKFRHGDFFIMNGPDIQTYYEHRLKMDSMLRFALTCRHVKPTKDLEPYLHLGEYDTASFKYDGASDGNPRCRERMEMLQAGP